MLKVTTVQGISGKTGTGSRYQKSVLPFGLLVCRPWLSRGQHVLSRIKIIESAGSSFHGPTLSRYCLTVAAVGVLSFCELAEAAQFGFKTDNGEMNNSSNWDLISGSSGSGIPGGADDAFIRGGLTAILGDGSDMTISRVSVGTLFGAATMNILDGSLNVTSIFWLGEVDSGGGGTVTVDGSSAVINVAPAAYFLLGSGNAGKLTISNGGQVNSSTNVWLADEATGSGELNINSGAVLQAPNVIEGDGNGTVNFDGGVLRLTGNQPDLFLGFESGDIILKAGGGFIDTNGYNAATSVGLQGTGGLTKQGGGTLTLAGTNTYSGGTTIDEGILSISSNSNLGDANGVLVFDGGTLQATADLTLSNNRNILLSDGGGTIDTKGHNVTYNGGFQLSNGGLVKQGSGTLRLTGFANYKGNTTISEGTLEVSWASNGGSYINNGAIVFNNASGSGTNLSSNLSGTGSFTKDGLGDLGMFGNKTYTGNTYINGGRLTTNGVNALGNNSAVSVGAAGSLVLWNNLTIGSLTGAGAINLSASGANTLTLGGDNTSTTFSGVLSGADGSLTKTGTGTQTLSGTNTYTGGTTINNGTLSVSANANLGDSSGALSFDGGTLQTTASFSTSRATTLNAGDGTFSVDAGTTLTHSGQISGTGTLIKTGTGTLTLSALNNTYSGGTVVSQGTLRFIDLAIDDPENITNNATVEFNRVAAGGSTNYFDVMSGTGNLIKTGEGGVGLFGANTYTGGTTISGGILSIAGTAGSVAGDIVNQGTLRFFRSNAYTHAGNVSGTGDIDHVGLGTTTIIGDLTHTGGTAISSGTLQIGNGGTTGSISGNVTNNSTLAFNRSDALTFGGVVSGTGGVQQNGTGNLNLTGINTYSGGTTINSGILSVNGSIANSATTVNAGGTLGGTGTVGNVTINGGTLAPGNSIGTLNVAGNVDFSAGGTYAVEVDAAGNSDKINATGSATLTNGTVLVLPEAGNYNLSTDYTILTAAGGLGGTTFNSVSSNLAFLTPSLSYNANNVFLNLRRNDVSFSAVAGTLNQTAVGTVIDELSTTNQDNIRDLLNNLFILTADGVNQAYDSLSGVQHTYGNHIALQSINQFKGLLFDRIQGNNQFLAHDGKLMLAYNEAGTMSDAGASLIDRSVSPQRGWWLRGTGNYGDIDDTRNASGAHYKAGGVAAGIDLDLDGNLTLGGAFGYTRTDADVANGGLDVDSYQAALYGRLTLRDDYYLSGMTGVGFHDMKANRQVTVGLLSNTAEADYDAWTGNIAIEGGRKLTFNSNTSITPFAGFEYAHINRDSFTEKDGGVANLKVKQDKQDSLRSVIGARLTHSWTTHGYRITPTAELGWIHEFMENESSIKAGFATAPTATFSVDGPDLDRDRARLAFGLNVQLSQTANLNLGYQGEYAGSDERHDIAATFRMFW